MIGESTGIVWDYAFHFLAEKSQVIFTMIALISENAHWAVWLMVSLGVCLMSVLAVHYVSIVMARSGCESHLTSSPYYLRFSDLRPCFCFFSSFCHLLIHYRSTRNGDLNGNSIFFFEASKSKDCKCTAACFPTSRCHWMLAFHGKHFWRDCRKKRCKRLNPARNTWSTRSVPKIQTRLRMLRKIAKKMKPRIRVIRVCNLMCDTVGGFK